MVRTSRAIDAETNANIETSAYTSIASLYPSWVEFIPLVVCPEWLQY